MPQLSYNSDTQEKAPQASFALPCSGSPLWFGRGLGETAPGRADLSRPLVLWERLAAAAMQGCIGGINGLTLLHDAFAPDCGVRVPQTTAPRRGLAHERAHSGGVTNGAW